MHTQRRFAKFRLLIAFAALSGTVAGHASMLEDVRAAGTLRCGINTGLTGFASTDDTGRWVGFDVAYCRALAAAVLGDPEKIKFVNLTGKNRFVALQSGDVDVLSRNTTWTYSRDANLKLTFAGVNFYDGQGFLGRKSLGVSGVKELDGASICILTGTTTELNLYDWFRTRGLTYESVPVETNADARAAYKSERCDAYTSDISDLAATRATLDDPDAHMIFPEIISKEPLGPLVLQGDEQWADIARWVLNALVIAEEHGITQANVADMAAGTENPEINRMLGSEGRFGAMLGLEPDWAVRAIAAEGNYAEIFDRYIGPDTRLGLERGLNALYKHGGILYAPPFL